MISTNEIKDNEICAREKVQEKCVLQLILSRRQKSCISSRATVCHAQHTHLVRMYISSSRKFARTSMKTAGSRFAHKTCAEVTSSGTSRVGTAFSNSCLPFW